MWLYLASLHLQCTACCDIGSEEWTDGSEEWTDGSEEWTDGVTSGRTSGRTGSDEAALKAD